MMASTKYALAAGIVAGCLVLPSTGWAQVTDFSGTWRFDETKSTTTPELVAVGGSEGTAVNRGGRAGGGGGAGGGGAAPAAGAARGGGGGGGRAARTVDTNRMVIKQTATDLNILDGGVALVYKLDGSENTVSALNRPGYPKGKAVWEGNKLVLSTSQQVYIGKAQFAPRTTKQVYSLDGGVLTIEKTETSPQGVVKTEKLVYTKATT